MQGAKRAKRPVFFVLRAEGLSGRVLEGGKMRNCVYFMEKNVHGAWVVYGEMGVRQYYYYTKKEARRRYIEECQATLFVNQGA